MRKFLDAETNTLVSEEELREEFERLKAVQPLEYNYSFEEYIQNCTSKNGFLREVKNLLVCEHCLLGIESREGRQATFTHYVDGENETISRCEWCEEHGFDTLYELV